MNNFATLGGTASVLANGYTYSYVHTKSEKGERCCRPIKSKCIVNENFGNTCKISRGRNRCGKDCTRIIKSLEELEQKEKKKKERKQHRDYNQIGPKKYEQEAEGYYEPKSEGSAPRRHDQYSYEGYSAQCVHWKVGWNRMQNGAVFIQSQRGI